MVVRDFDVVGITALPAETYSILLVDTDAVLAPTIPCQTLEPISRWDCKLA